MLAIQLLLGGCSLQPSYSYEKAENGIIDLTKLQFENDIAKLDGQWEYYPNQLLEPGEIDSGSINGYIAVPGTWNKYTTKEGFSSGDGYATYRMTLITDETKRLALKIPRIFTAYKLWVNGELIASAGTVDKTRDTMIPQYLPQVAFFEAKDSNEIVVQVSNFYHRSGGILESIHIGGEKQILSLRYQNIASDALLFGCLIFIGAYHLALFLFRKKNTSALYFGLFCILVGTRTLFVGECFFIYLFPDFSWEIAHKIMTLTFYLGVPLIMMFFLSVFPKYFHVRMIKLAQIIAAAFVILIVLTPAKIFTQVNPFYQIWTGTIIIYLIAVLIKISIHKEKDSWLIIVGASVFILSSINDIIFLSIWMNDNGPEFLKTIIRTGNLSSLGQFVFTFTNSLLLARKFSNSLDQEEIMTAKLIKMNANLDKIVFDRTEVLVEANKKIQQQKLELEEANMQLQKLSLKDPLTQLWNRRKYDEIIRLEWHRCLRLKTPIALIIIDIDKFKGYNDYYGHLAGDECLRNIGQSISTALSDSAGMVARYGGEEFTAILPETRRAEAVEIADMLRKKIESLHIPHEKSTVSKYVTVSAGVTFTIPNINSSHENLFKAADKALYQAKAAGRNRIEFLDEQTFNFTEKTNKEG